MSTKVDTVVAQQVEIIIQGRETPFRTMSEYIRAALLHFHTEVVTPALRDKKLVKDIRVMQGHLNRARMMERMLDVDKFITTNKDILLKISRREGYEPEVKDLWDSMMVAARSHGGRFYKHVARWAKSDPAMGKVRGIIKKERGRDE